MNKVACSIIPTALLTFALFATLHPATPRASAEDREEKEGEHHKKHPKRAPGEEKEEKEGEHRREKSPNRVRGEEKEKDDEDEDEVIEKVMKICCKSRKGTPKLAEKIVEGTATEEETKKLIASYRTLKGTKPPKGDHDAWNRRIDALLVAVDALEKKEPGAADKFEDANSCKACHEAHRRKDD